MCFCTEFQLICFLIYWFILTNHHTKLNDMITCIVEGTEEEEEEGRLSFTTTTTKF